MQRQSAMRKMGKVATDSELFAHGVAGGARRARVWVAEANMIVNEVANRPYPCVAAGESAELGPGKIRERVAVAIAARKQELQHVIGEAHDWREFGIGRRRLGLAAVFDQRTDCGT